MSGIIFKKLEAQNFLSLKEIELVFSDSISFISGVNGVGKSSIMESFFYSIYGEPLRDIKKNEIKNRFSKEDTTTTIHFDIGSDSYTVRRNVNKSLVVFFKNGTDISRTTLETNKDIESTIGISKDFFSKIYALNNSAFSFFSLKKADKRLFIESLFKIDFLKKYSDVFKKKHNEAKNAFSLQSNALAILQEQLEETKKGSDRFFEQKKEKKLQLETLISSLKYVDAATPPEEPILEELIDITDLRDEGSLLQNECNNLKKQLASFKENSICHACNRPYDDHEEKQNKALALEADLSTKNSRLRVIADEFNSRKKHNSEIESRNYNIRSRYESARTKYDSIIKDNGELDIKKSLYIKNMEDLDLTQDPFEPNIAKLQNRISETTDSVKMLSEDNRVYSILKDVFSEIGVRAYIINTLITTFNNLINQHLSNLKSNYKLVFDKFLDETLYDQYKNEISYHSLSTGERVRIDFALILAFRQLRQIKNDQQCNVTFLDEVFDSGLDSDGLNDCFRVLKSTKMANESMFIVSHRKDLDNFDCNFINLEKSGFFTQIKPN